MDKLSLSRSLGQAVHHLQVAAGSCDYDPLKEKMRRAYRYLQEQREEIEAEVLAAYEQGAA